MPVCSFARFIGLRSAGDAGDAEVLHHRDTPAQEGAHHAAARPPTQQRLEPTEIVEAATVADVELIADLGYHGAGGTVRAPVKRKPGRGLSPRDQRANREHARVRYQGVRGFAQLKAYKVLRRVRIRPSRITTLAHSVHAVIRLRRSPMGV